MKADLEGKRSTPTTGEPTDAPDDFADDEPAPPRAPPRTYGNGRVRVQDRAWTSLFLLNKSGMPIDHLSNIHLILTRDTQWRDRIRHNAFADQIETVDPPWLDGLSPSHVETHWSDDHDSRLAVWITREFGLRARSNTCHEAVSMIARENAYHPVRDYLAKLQWDGTPRLAGFLPTYFGAPDNDYTRGVGRRWMISCVARIVRPGCQVDCTMLLIGPQGSGKTTAFRNLVPEPNWYADSGIDIANKDSFINLRSVWIYGLDELESLKRGQLARWKNFLTATRDHYRPPYGRCSQDFPRHTVFCGTTNEPEFLEDRTGNRRFWPVQVGTVDMGAISRDRDQLWAEAMALYERGEKWHVDTPEFRALCEAEQEERVHEDPWAQIVGPWLADPYVIEKDDSPPYRVHKIPFDEPESGWLTSDVLVHALEKRKGDLGKHDHMRMADVLRSLGYVRGPQHRENGQRVRRYQLQPGTTAATGSAEVVTQGGDELTP
jgi:putative DNA primase/helicase